MAQLDPALERRRHPRVQPRSRCELVIGGVVWPGIVADTSKGGLFVRTEATASRGEPVTVRHEGAEHIAVVVHVRKPARSLLRITIGGLGLRWLQTK